MAHGQRLDTQTARETAASSLQNESRAARRAARADAPTQWQALDRLFAAAKREAVARHIPEPSLSPLRISRFSAPSGPSR